MYTTTNFKTGKAVKEAVAAGKRVGVYHPNNIFGTPDPKMGEEVTIEGPHYPEPHRWYLRVRIGADGCIDKVLK